MITDVAALKETGGPEATYIQSERLYSDEYNQQKFIKAVVTSLKNPQTPAQIKKQEEFADRFSWDKIAGQWKGVIDEA